MQQRALVLTGTVGAGKTIVAQCLGSVLAAADRPHGIVDLDWLVNRFPRPQDDPFDFRLMLRNLEALAKAFLRGGAEWLVVAGVVETHQRRDSVAAALGVPTILSRLRADLTVVHGRLRLRHDGDVASLDWHLRRSGELDALLGGAALEDVSVDAYSSDAMTVALRVFDWISEQETPNV